LETENVLAEEGVSQCQPARGGSGPKGTRVRELIAVEAIAELGRESGGGAIRIHEPATAIAAIDDAVVIVGSE